MRKITPNIRAKRRLQLKANQKLAIEMAELAKKDKVDRQLTEHEKKIKIPVKLTDEMIEAAFEGELSCAKHLVEGKYIAAYIADGGIRVPNAAICFNTLQEAEKSCLSNNSRFNYTEIEINEIMRVSGLFPVLNNTLEEKKTTKKLKK
ncbi:MAG: hypothetical protein IMY67_11170 [Bacteroidetes bacterium]|nr:hypothetical protein [Bacteroidota bacterium]